MATADLEKELKEGIAYFEQILDVLPGDSTALEFLCVAYAQLEDREKFLMHAMALAEVVLREKNVEGAVNLIEKLKTCDDPRAQTAMLKLKVLVGPKPDLTFERPDQQWVSAKLDVAVQAERALLEKLVADGVLTKSLVQVAFEQLANPPTSGGDFLISALYILEKENLTGAADAVAAVADAAHAPPIPVESFDIVPAYVRQLPDRLVKVRGVIPFAKLGREWCVAVLNPLDETLRQEVAEALGAKCHFFLAQPGTVDKVIERLFDAGDEAGEKSASVVPAVSDEAPPVQAPLGSRAQAGFTFVEVLVAMMILILLPAGALVTTVRLEKFARQQSEEMAAASFCEDVYNRYVREEKTDNRSWKNFSVKNGACYASSGTASGIYLPSVCLANGSFYSPLYRDGYQVPQYRVVVNSSNKYDVRVSLRWGPNREYYYHK